MSFRILHVSATSAEAATLEKSNGLKEVRDRFVDLQISHLVTGVGSVATAWSMIHWLTLNGKPDLAINGGLAGSYRDDIELGEVVMPLTECFADAGIEDGENFLTLAESGLISADEFPFKDGLIYADPAFIEKMKGVLRPVKAITVNTITGSEATRIRLLKKFNPDIETMEGATFFYICSRENIPFLALRAISNKVESRNKMNWDISLAQRNLSEKLIEVLLTLKKKHEINPGFLTVPE